MKSTLFVSIVLALMAEPPARASLMITLDPPDGQVSGDPGDIVGWGFTFITDDSSYYVLNLTDFCVGPQSSPCSNSVGTYTDFAAGINGLIIGADELPSGYSEAFDNTAQTGIGSFSINTGLSPQSLAATLFVNFDVYDDDPVTGAGNYIDTETIYVPVQVNVSLPNSPGVPEPATWVFMPFALGQLAWRKSRRRRRSNALP